MQFYSSNSILSVSETTKKKDFNIDRMLFPYRLWFQIRTPIKINLTFKIFYLTLEFIYTK